MYKLKLIVDDNERWLNKLNYEYFCPVKDNKIYYRKFLQLNFPFDMEDSDHLSPYHKGNIPSIRLSRLDRELKKEALRESESDFTSNDFDNTPKTPKERYYTALTRLRYSKGLDHGIIPNIDRKYDRYIRPQQAVCKPVEFNKFGGIFNLELTSTSNDDFWYQWMLSSQLKNGRIEFYEGDGDMAFKIQFWDCFCISIGEQMSSLDHLGMIMQMRISPAITQNRNEIHEKVWKISQFSEWTPVRNTSIEPALVETYMTDLNGNRITEYEIEEHIRLVLRTENMIGHEVTINLNDKDADFEYNGKRLPDDVLRNYAINANSEQIELTVIEPL